MNRQAGYILNAILLLLFAGVITWFIQVIPPSEKKNTSSVFIDNYSPEQSKTLSDEAAKGKMLFMSKCAACHNLFKDMTGPGLTGFTERGPWADRKNVYEWIRNPAAFIKKNEYARSLRDKFKLTMTAFPDLTDEEIDAICTF